MTTHTGMRKAGQIAAVAALATGTLAMPAASASADDHAESLNTIAADPDLSPSTQKAWADFISGGAEAGNGAAKMVSGAWIGAPAIITSATGEELTDSQMKAWKNWDEGGEQFGHGAAKVVSGAYVGAPGYIIDKIAAGAAPSDLSRAEMRKVSFMMPTDTLPSAGLPTDLLSLDALTALLGFAPV